MKRNLLPLIILLLSASLLGGCLGAAQQPARLAEYVTAEEAYSLMRSDPDFVLIDTRTAGEFANEHIEGAVNIDYRSDSFHDEINRLDKGGAIFVYYKYYKTSGHILDCVKCDESYKTYQAIVDIFATFQGLEFQEFYFIKGGVLAWKINGFPTTE